MSPHLFSQAKREEAVSVLAQLEDGPWSDGGRRPEHCNGLRREAEGRSALVCVREAILHQHAGARCAHELLTLFFACTLCNRRKQTSMSCCFMVCFIVIWKCAPVYSAIRQFISALLKWKEHFAFFVSSKTDCYCCYEPSEFKFWYVAFIMCKHNVSFIVFRRLKLFCARWIIHVFFVFC